MSEQIQSLGLDFEGDLIALALTSAEDFARVSRIVSAEQITVPQFQFLWSLCESSVAENNELPTKGIVTHEARAAFGEDEFPAFMAAYDELASTVVESPKTVMGHALRFVQQKKFIAAFAQAERLNEAGEYAKASQVMEEMYRELPTEVGRGWESQLWMENFEKRQAERKYLKENPDNQIQLSTGIFDLDTLMGGGYNLKDLLYIMAVTNRGKSIVCTHFGYTNIQNGYGGIHFSTEMHHSRVAARYDSRWTGILHEKFRFYDFTEQEERAILAKLEKDRERLSGLLQIVSMPNQTTTREKIVEAMKIAGDQLNNFTWMVMDCGDHIKPPAHIRDYRLGQADNAWWLDSLFEDQNLAGIVTAQANREGADWTGNENASESYAKAQCADWIIALNQEGRTATKGTPKNEVDEDAKKSDTDAAAGTHDVKSVAGNLVFSLTKARDGMKGDVTVSTDLSRMLIAEDAINDHDHNAHKPLIRTKGEAIS